MPTQKPLFDLDEPLSSPDFRTHERALKNLQGNILKSHGRDVAVHVFLIFKPRKRGEARQFLADFANRIISAAAQQDQRDRFKRTRKSELFVTLSLSARGYEYLGFSHKELRTAFSDEFLKGMQRAKLDDPSPERWEANYRKPIHAMAILAHNKREELERELAVLRKQVRDFADISTEWGAAIHHGTKHVFEHFGYRDGLSQPLFFQSQIPKKKNKQWDPSAGPSLVLVKDRLAKSPDACGTYFVFRKLEQNVEKFRARVANLASSLKLRGRKQELAGAMIIGRFPDGTPVANHSEAGHNAANDFLYSKLDPEGNQCPFFAHIRKANPRNGDGDREHRIVRRGITYGDPVDSSAKQAASSRRVGLLFQCCQANLHDQFEFIQHAWADDTDSPSKGAGKDPVIGQSPNGFPKLHFPDPWNTPGRQSFNLHSLVKMKGGEYFFVPSISFLQSLPVQR